MKKMKLASYNIYIVLMLTIGSTLIYAFDKNERIDYGMLEFDTRR